jgi:hypothetical protein
MTFWVANAPGLDRRHGVRAGAATGEDIDDHQAAAPRGGGARVGQVDAQRRRATVARLVELREAGTLTAQHVRLAASGHGVDERTVRRWLARAEQDRPVRPDRYRLSEADREAYAFYRGNVAAIERARAAVVAAALVLHNGEYDDMPGPTYAEWREDHLDHERALRVGGLLYADHKPQAVKINPEVLYSLRCQDSPHRDGQIPVRPADT